MSFEPLSSNDKDRNQGLPWGECILCGTLSHQAAMRFKDGTVQPQVGEVLSGVTTGRTGIVSAVFLESGAWDGTGAGTIQMISPTGFDGMDLILFLDGEVITGSIGGAGLVATDGDAWVTVSGKMYHRQQVVVYNGQKFCLPHFRYRYYHRFIDQAKIDLPEDIRFLSWD